MKLRQQLRQIGSGVRSGWPERAYRKQRYQQRLLVVQQHLAKSLDLAPHGSLRIISMCAGDGRDVVDVLASHPRQNDVAAWLVELDSQSVAVGARYAASIALPHTITFLNKDATDYATYNSIAPSDIVLACGVWGHVPVDERGQLVHAFALLCKPGGAVIWTRGVSRGLARLREIQSLFAATLWEQTRLTFTPDQRFSVATHRYCGGANKLPASGRIFNFQRNAGR